ncbi:MAG: hypothetical protein R6V85_00530 [Polyangia bacterium]
MAVVGIRGRAVLADEGDGFWMYGVQPGGISGGGPDRGLAFYKFRESYNSVLFDIASEAATFAEFESQVEELFSQINRPNFAIWDDALDEVRRSKLSLQGLERVDADTRTPELTVFEVDTSRTSPSDNQIDSIGEAA